MTTLALVNATDLVAEEFRAALEERHDLWHEMRLLATDEEEIGTLVDVRGAAAMVNAASENNWDDVDVAVFFGEVASYQKFLDTLPPGATGLVVTGLEAPPVGQTMIAGVNLDGLDRFETLISPHGAAVGLAQILQPLLPFSPSWASATAMLPVSVFGKEALDELMDQARDLLSFSTKTEFDRLPGPLAFNLLESPLGRLIADQTRAALGNDLKSIAVQVVQAGLFHGLGLAVQIGFEDSELTAERLTEVLEAQPTLDFAAEPERLGPKEVVSRPEVMISEVRSTGGGTFALWAALDPLTVGGSRNLIAILEALKAPLSN